MQPEPGFDVVGGNIIVESAPGSRTFTVTYSGTRTETYTLWGADNSPDNPTFAWSKQSNVYHFATCRYVQNISPNNLERESTPPTGKTLHEGCPQ